MAEKYQAQTRLNIASANPARESSSAKKGEDSNPHLFSRSSYDV